SKSINILMLILRPDPRFDRLSAAGQPLDDRDVEIAVNGHGQRAGNGRSRHHQHMRMVSFLQDFSPLFYTKAMLLVNDCKPQFVKGNFFLNNCMRGYYNLAASAFYIIKDILAKFVVLTTHQQT